MSSQAEEIGGNLWATHFASARLDWQDVDVREEERTFSSLLPVTTRRTAKRDQHAAPHAEREGMRQMEYLLT